MTIYTIRDAFAGDIEQSADSAEQAVALAYEGIPADERPTYVHVRMAGSEDEQQVEVPQGQCEPQC